MSNGGYPFHGGIPSHGKAREEMPCRRGRRASRAVSQITGLLLMIALVSAAVSGYYMFYKGFFHESKRNVNMDMPQITLHGPTSGNLGGTIMLSVKNSGNVDFTGWSFVEGCTESGTDLLVGDQVSVSATLDGAGPWTFKVQAQTTSGKIVEDSWAVEKT